MDLLYVSGENNFRFYSTTVKFPLISVCERNNMDNCAYGPDGLRLICLWCRVEILQYHKKRCMKYSVLKVQKTTALVCSKALLLNL